MYRPLRQARASEPAPAFEMDGVTDVSGELVYRSGPLAPAKVSAGDDVVAGQILAEGSAFAVRSAVAGKVHAATSAAIHLLPHAGAVWPPAPQTPETETSVFTDFPAFLARIGLRGMGGALFPAALKMRASHGVNTVVINAVECEPGLSVDRAILFHDPEAVSSGAQAVARAVGAKRIVLALRRDAALERQVKTLYEFERLWLDSTYPAGAERLILRALVGLLPPAGILPFQLGVLVHNVASLRAVGRALRDGVPAIERPLTLRAGSLHRNLLVPVGMRIGDLLRQTGISPAAEDAIVTGGPMMGTAATPTTPITLGTAAVLIVPHQRLRRPQRGCIRCGACCDACPLGLHPITLVRELARPPVSETTQVQLTECFLCGCCSAVCPAYLPLAEDLRRAKAAKP